MSILLDLSRKQVENAELEGEIKTYKSVCMGEGKKGM